ncbi:MAG: hypothetical protein R3242_06635 [Akkermansiaceae bacterium]|nr:hypothetical protein [Akkermansiaceae bacterium]
MLKPEHFSFKCPLRISDLEKTGDGGHFCAKCSKDIHDLTDCSIEEVIELQRRKGSICGFVRAVSVTSLVSLAACSDEENAAKHQDEGKIPPKPEVPEKIQPELMGDICVPEEEAPKPRPEPKPAPDDSTVENQPPPNGEEPQVINPDDVEINPPVLLGVICPQEDLDPGDPEELKPLDPHREGSPG